jgi:6-phosphogluconolactonase
MKRVIREQDPEKLLELAARAVCEGVGAVLSLGQRVNLAVPGGRSAARIFRALREEPLDWGRVHFFMVDERLVPIGHPDSNFKLFQEGFVAPLVAAGRFPAANAHPFLFDPAAADRGAKRYEETLARYGLRFDVVLLSAGEDGHIGALYPRHPSIEDRHQGFLVMDDSPKPPPERMSSSLSLLQTASAAVLLFAGEGKREAYRRFNDEKLAVADCPAKLLLAVDRLTVLTDLE